MNLARRSADAIFTLPPHHPRKIETMPELPDVEVYIEAIERRIAGEPLTGIRLGNPFVLRSVDPPPAELAGRRVESVRRLGKRIAIGLEGGYFIVVHLM